MNDLFIFLAITFIILSFGLTWFAGHTINWPIRIVGTLWFGELLFFFYWAFFVTT